MGCIDGSSSSQAKTLARQTKKMVDLCRSSCRRSVAAFREKVALGWFRSEEVGRVVGQEVGQSVAFQQ